MLRIFLYAKQNFPFAIPPLVYDIFYSNSYTHESTYLIKRLHGLFIYYIFDSPPLK